MTLFEIIIVVFAAYCVVVACGITCIIHHWNEHGPTRHMAITKDGKIEGWSRYWWVCSRCGARRRGRKEITND